ncbi:MAG TPA: hypothetical protein VLH56_18045 [Dissulfurispiraceae bacterium]|nr:hypothetical protein [Dissulfurispiraceae bacterium]
MKILTSYIGKNREFQAWLRLLQAPNVIYLQRCEMCGRMAASAICRGCEPMYLGWTKKIRAELKKENRRSGEHHTPTIA